MDPAYGDEVVAIGPRASWMDAAACRGATRFFFGPNGERPEARARRERVALAMCATCPVRSPCGELAELIGERHGIWAGETEQDRYRRQRRQRIVSVERRAG
jgi:WhiB family redox-sensing transcriptional regulator